MKDQAEPSPPTGYLLWHLSLRWRVSMDRVLAPLKLTHAQYALLASLHALQQGGVRPSQRQLANYCGLEPMYVSKLTRTLVAGGFAERADNPADPRAVQVSLTAHGAEIVETAVRLVAELEERYLEPLGGRAGAENTALRRMLWTLLEHAQSVGATPAPTAFSAGD